MANINQLVRRKQNLRMALIGLGISAVGGLPGICLPRSMQEKQRRHSSKKRRRPI